ncbi:MAG: ergothioneine biosynthesis protein EgtB, partial [Myxococcota bacterium]
YTSCDDRYRMFFNSYYVHVSERVPQAHRGTFSRPTVEEVHRYRACVDQAMVRFIGRGLTAEQHDVIELGIHHEQQHQELLIMDIKSHLFQAPFYPRYQTPPRLRTQPGPSAWRSMPGGLVEIGQSGELFCFDNERPRHKTYLEPFQLRDRTVTNGEWLEFIQDGGYQDARLWLSDGWKSVETLGWDAPMYWVSQDDEWLRFSLQGLIPLDLDSPVSHVSYYEADAFARWAKARLPREIEWEAASQIMPDEPGSFLEDGALDPVPVPFAMAGNVWEWTSSGYESYPGYSAPDAALGEYNAKFMVNQKVLRGGCCATPQTHYRHTYRNFFYPHQRWPFTGVRLAR